MSKYRDAFHRSATIEAFTGPAYYRGPIRTSYRLIIQADYNRGMIIHVSCHDSEEAARQAMLHISNTFR